jgi:DNA-binding LacI/PurR family transcriptional regulator
MPERSRDLPMVFVDREPVGIEADAVISDNAVGAAKAAAHLISQGHTKLAYLGGRTDIQTARERRRGFIDELGRAGIPTVPFLVTVWLPGNRAFQRGSSTWAGQAGRHPGRYRVLGPEAARRSFSRLSHHRLYNKTAKQGRARDRPRA